MAIMSPGSVEGDKCTTTGIGGLDGLLEGRGIPQGYNVLVMGSPGSGKTTFALQFLHYGCTVGEAGIYVSLDESPETLVRNMWRYDIGLEIEIGNKKLALVDASPIRSLPGQVQLGPLSIGKRDFSLVSLIEAVRSNVKKTGAKRLAIDPITSFLLQFPEEAERRTAVMDLLQGVAPLGCTTVFMSELKETGMERQYQFEEYLAQGVIILRRTLRQSGIVQSIQIEKMRGVNHDTQLHPYKFTKKGLEVYPLEVVL